MIYVIHETQSVPTGIERDIDAWWILNDNDLDPNIANHKDVLEIVKKLVVNRLYGSATEAEVSIICQGTLIVITRVLSQTLYYLGRIMLIRPTNKKKYFKSACPF